MPYDDPNAMGAALIDAAAAAGIRITLLDTCYLHGGIGVELDPIQRRFGDGDALGWATSASDLDRLTSATARVGAAIHSVRAVDPASAEVVGAWAAERDVPLHCHVSEQPAENEQCVAAYGVTPVGLLDRHGLLGERFTAVHATHLTDTDVAVLGASRTTVCLCPTTERDLADGIGPALALRDAGSALALGSDSHAVIDLFEESRAVEHHERLASLVRGNHDAPSLLRAATANGHASLGWPEAGRLEVGALADLCTVRLDSVRLAGARREHLLESVVFAATAADVDHVVVGGEVIVRDGAHVRSTSPASWPAPRRPCDDHRARPHRRPRDERRGRRWRWRAVRSASSPTPTSCSTERRSSPSAPAPRQPPTGGSTPAGGACCPASSTATRTSCSPATVRRSSHRGWPAARTRRAGST